MAGRLAVDFGTSNTVLALWDPARQEGLPLRLSEYSRSYQQDGSPVYVIPSLIHYAEDDRRWIGSQVIQRGLYQSQRTFRWMKRYISSRSPIRVRLNGREITPYQAGEDFLSTLLLFAGEETGANQEEVAFSVPVEAYEHYENWLVKVAENAAMPRFRLIDEPSAAALGYGAHIQPGNAYLIFDFGGGTLHAAVVLMEAEASQDGGRRCRVLGKAGRTIGGTSIDQWLYMDFLKRNHRLESDEEIRRLSNLLLVECERIKETLSFQESADLNLINPDSGEMLSAAYTRSSFEEILDQHELYAGINQTVRGAINAARERGYNEESIQAVLMVGGSSQIPSVQRALRQYFGKERVFFNRPLDAIARGAAAFVAGVDFFDHIQHTYAIRYINPQKGTYDYHPIVPSGTRYPTTQPVSRLTIKASYDGQSQLGLAIYEMSHNSAPSKPEMELVFDPTGAARVIQLSPHEQEQRSLYWMNESSPTFLSADPPARQGEARFEVEFNIDANKRLTITSRDLSTGMLTHKDFPVVRLV